MLLIPPTGTAMEFWDLLGLCLQQATAQDLGKQLVVAIPSPLIIERDHEEIGMLNCLQHRLPTRLLRHRITEWSREAVQNAGVEEKRLHRGRLLQEDIL